MQQKLIELPTSFIYMQILVGPITLKFSFVLAGDIIDNNNNMVHWNLKEMEQDGWKHSVHCKKSELQWCMHEKIQSILSAPTMRA
jgi:hypothetical protein